MTRLPSRWIGPVRVDIRITKDLEAEDGERCDGLFCPGDGYEPATIWLDSLAPVSTLKHEWHHAVEHYVGALTSSDIEELKVNILELLEAQWDR